MYYYIVINMIQNETLEKPKSYETVPSSRFEAAESSLDYLGDTFTKYLGMAGIKANNYLDDLEQERPRAGRVARVALPFAIYLAIPIARAAATMTFDQMTSELFTGYNSADVNHLTVLVDMPKGEAYIQAPVGCEGDIIKLFVDGKTMAQFPITDDHHIGAAVFNKNLNGTIIGSRVLEMTEPKTMSDAVKALQDDSVQKVFSVAEAAGAIDGHKDTTVEVYLSGKGDLMRYNGSDCTNQHDATIRVATNYKTDPLKRYDFQGVSGIIEDIRTGRLGEKVSGSINGARGYLGI
jgi:hypothetical protein